MHKVVLAVLACACEGKPPTVLAPLPAEKQLAHAAMTLPPRWVALYEPTWDRWFFASDKITARFERAAPGAVASPDAYIHHRRPARARTIEKRESLRDGFAVTVALDGQRGVYIVRELANTWTQCWSETVVDDTTRDDVLALCKSITRARR